MNEKKITKAKNTKQKMSKGFKTSLPLFLAIACIIAAGILFYLYANAYMTHQTILSSRVVTAEYVDIQEGLAVGEASLAAKRYTLIYQFTDGDGTVYRKANSDRRYDNRELALSHLGEKIQIRIDGKGNHTQNTLTDFSGKNGLLIAGIFCTVAAIILIVLWTTAAGEKVGLFFSAAGRLIAGNKRQVQSIILAALFAVLLICSLSFGLSGLSGNEQIKRYDKMVADNCIVEATYTGIISTKVAGVGSPGTFFIEYEYVDREKGDMVYRGKYNSFDHIANVPEMREKYVGKALAVYIDAAGGSLPVGKNYSKTVIAYQWTGLGLGLAATIALLIYFPVRNKKKNRKVCKENHKGFL